MNTVAYIIFLGIVLKFVSYDVRKEMASPLIIWAERTI